MIQIWFPDGISKTFRPDFSPQHSVCEFLGMEDTKIVSHARTFDSSYSLLSDNWLVLLISFLVGRDCVICAHTSDKGCR